MEGEVSTWSLLRKSKNTDCLVCRAVLFTPWNIPDSNDNGANLGPILCRQDPLGPHVGPMNVIIRDNANRSLYTSAVKFLSHGELSNM